MGMADKKTLERYLELADRLIDIAEKEQLAECARLLALNVAHYEMLYGELPMDAALDATYLDELNGKQTEWAANGMKTMVGVLGNVIQKFENRVSH